MAPRSRSIIYDHSKIAGRQVQGKGAVAASSANYNQCLANHEHFDPKQATAPAPANTVRPDRSATVHGSSNSLSGMWRIVRKERPHPAVAPLTRPSRGPLRTARDTGAARPPVHGATQNQIWLEF